MSEFWRAAAGWAGHTAVTGAGLLLIGWLLLKVTKSPIRRHVLAGWVVRAAALVPVLCLIPAWVPIPIPAWLGQEAPRPSPRVIEAPVAVVSAHWPEVPPDAMPGPEPTALAMMPERSPRSNGSEFAGNPWGPVGPADPVIPDVPPDVVWNVPRAEVAAIPEGNAILPAPQAPPPDTTRRVRSTPATPPQTLATRLTPFVVSLYWLIALILIGQLIAGHLTLMRWSRRGTAAPARVQTLFDAMAAEYRVSPRLVVSDHVASPACFGLWRPTVLLPTAFAVAATTAELNWVFAHELDHLRRGDHRTAWWLGMVRGLYYFVPWFWPIRRDLTLTQEYLADAAAVSSGGSPVDYAAFLVSLSGGPGERRPARPPFPASGAAGRSDLFRRITMLVERTEPLNTRSPRTWAVLAAVGSFSAAVLLSSLGFATADEKQPAKPAETPQKDPVKTEKPKDPVKGDAPREGDKPKPEATKTDKPKPDATKTDKPKPEGDKPKPEGDKPKDPVKTEKPKGEAPREGDKPKPVGDKPKGDAPREGDKPRVEGDKPKDPAARREGDKPRDPNAPREGDKPKDPTARRDGDKPRDPNAPRDGDKPRDPNARRDGDKPRDPNARRDGDKPRAEITVEEVDALKKKIIIAATSGNVEELRKLSEELARMMAQQRIAPFAADPRGAMPDVNKLKQAMAERIRAFEQDIEKLKGSPEAQEAMRRAMDEYRKAIEQSMKAEGLRADAQRAAGRAEEFLRGGEKLFAGREAPPSRLGVAVSPVPEILVDQLDLPKNQGLLVIGVQPGSVAEKMGVRKNDVLLAVSGQAVTADAGQFAEQVARIKSGEKFDLVVLRKGKKEEIKGIELAEVKREKLRVEVELAERRPRIEFEQMQVSASPEGFQINATKGDVKYHLEGKRDGGKLVPTSIVVASGKSKDVYKSVSDVPEDHRAAVAQLLTSVR